MLAVRAAAVDGDSAPGCPEATHRRRVHMRREHHILKVVLGAQLLEKSVGI